MNYSAIPVCLLCRTMLNPYVYYASVPSDVSLPHKDPRTGIGFCRKCITNFPIQSATLNDGDSGSMEYTKMKDNAQWFN